MTQEQIEIEIEKRLDEPDNQWDSIFNSGFSRGFSQGVNWRIESVWHKPDEEPLHSEPCLIQLKNNTFQLAYSGKFKGEQPYFENCFISCTYDMDEIIRYCYIKDLIPTENER